MNLTEMISRVRSITRDSAGTFVTDADITAWLNEAQLDLAQRLRATQKTATGTTSGSTLALPSDLLEVTDLSLGGIDHGKPVDDIEFVEVKDNGLYVEHTIYRVFGNQIEFYPPPETGTTYALRYVYSPPDLAGSSASELPLGLHSRMLDYAKAHAKAKEGDDSESQFFLAKYEQGLPTSDLGQSKNNPGPIDLIPEMGPWDYALRS